MADGNLWRTNDTKYELRDEIASIQLSSLSTKQLSTKVVFLLFYFHSLLLFPIHAQGNYVQQSLVSLNHVYSHCFLCLTNVNHLKTPHKTWMKREIFLINFVISNFIVDIYDLLDYSHTEIQSVRSIAE